MTCDIAGGWAEMGSHYWRESGVAGKIDLRVGRAADIMTNLLRESGAGSFDMAFLDADKRSYPDYLEPLTELLRPGGLLVADNVLWRGRVADAACRDIDTGAVRAFNDALAQDQRFRSLMLPVSDGVTLAHKVSNGPAAPGG